MHTFIHPLKDAAWKLGHSYWQNHSMVESFSEQIHHQRALWSENNHACHIEGLFQSKVFKTGHFKGSIELKDFWGYKWWTLFAPMNFCSCLICSMKVPRMILVPNTLYLFKALTVDCKPVEGIMAQGWALLKETQPLCCWITFYLYKLLIMFFVSMRDLKEVYPDHNCSM